MRLFTLLIAFFLGYLIKVDGQTIDSPDKFLGYELGTQFTFHHRASEYFRYIADVSPLAEYREYGKSYEGRPLGICIVAGTKIMAKLDELRKNNLIKTGLLEGDFTGVQAPIIWLAYNVHGNESAGMETAMKVLYTLVTKSYPGTDEWLKSCIIVIDPCQNPDGRDLYTNRYRNAQTIISNPDGNAWEHNQGWPGARSNHYFFDLNRDWSWQTQTETIQRIALYNQFMPHVHADFHEMGSESTFFFPPGAGPWHEVITPWQHDFHKLMGKGNAGLFDEKSRLYYTKENFDLFCPSFGDTWPLFNGAAGFTYEQAGGGYSGIAVKTSSGDTLTLKKRIEGHFLATMATLKVSFENRVRLIEEFNKFFSDNLARPSFKYKSVIIKGANNKDDLQDLFRLLSANQIRYSYCGNTGKKYKGFDYLANNDGEVTIENGDILISAYQPQSKFMQVLFEPDSKASDSLSYDLTAWALPYTYNIKAYAVEDQIKPQSGKIESKAVRNILPGYKPYAYVVDNSGFNALKFISALRTKNIKVRYALKPFAAEGREYRSGSFIIARGDNLIKGDNLDIILMELANDFQVEINTSKTGFVEKGKDFGSEYAPYVKASSVAILCGNGISSGPSGELWYFFERELGYPVSLIDISSGDDLDFRDYDVLLLPSGNYSKIRDTLAGFAKNGGRIIAFEDAIRIFSSDKSTSLFKAVEKRNEELKSQDKKEKSDDLSLLKKFGDEGRHMLSERSAACIYKVTIDTTNPFAFGLGNEWFVMKKTEACPFIENGSNIGYILENKPVSGFAGYKFQKQIKNTLSIGSERMGRGEVIYFADNPYYRAFWKSGRTLLWNVVFR